MSFAPKEPPSESFLLDLFQKCDLNNSGTITPDELQTALSTCDWKPFNAKMIHMLMCIFDKDDDGTITFKEFGALWNYLVAWRNCFESFDHDGNNMLDKKELKTALKKLGYPLKSRIVTSYIEEYDKTGTGSLCFDDFIEICIEVSKKSYGPNIHEKMGEMLNF